MMRKVRDWVSTETNLQTRITSGLRVKTDSCQTTAMDYETHPLLYDAPCPRSLNPWSPAPHTLSLRRIQGSEFAREPTTPFKRSMTVLSLVSSLVRNDLTNFEKWASGKSLAGSLEHLAAQARTAGSSSLAEPSNGIYWEFGRNFSNFGASGGDIGNWCGLQWIMAWVRCALRGVLNHFYMESSYFLIFRE